MSSVREGRFECWQGQDASDVGSHARKGLGEHEARQGYANIVIQGTVMSNHSDPAEAELVRWNTDGSLFVVQTMSTLDVYNTV
jgi:hypothetical protein